jgi:hypothetical protein
MKGIMIEKYFVSESIAETKYYSEIVNYSSNLLMEQKTELILFETNLKDREKKVSFS